MAQDETTSITVRDVTVQEKEAFIKCCAAYYGKSASECLRDFIRAMPAFFNRDTENMAIAFQISDLLQKHPEEIDKIIERQVPIYVALGEQEKYITRILYSIMNKEEIFKEWQTKLNNAV